MAYKYDGKYISENGRRLFEFDGKYIKKYWGSMLYELTGRDIKSIAAVGLRSIKIWEKLLLKF